MKNIIFSLVLSGFASISCFAQSSTTTFDALLKKHVTSAGLVNYVAIKNENKLNQWIEQQKLVSPQSIWNDNQKLAYWINLYNALTIQLVLKYYPIKSIKDIGSVIQIPMINTPWDITVFELKGKLYSLNDIEHGIIRKEFDEPRIHFALVCAALSCPKLLNEAYTPTQLNSQLANQAKAFLGNETKNKLTESELQLSKLFNWYGGDFRKKTSLISYLKPYTPIPISDKAKISFMNYDWMLNEQK